MGWFSFDCSACCDCYQMRTLRNAFFFLFWCVLSTLFYFPSAAHAATYDNVRLPTTFVVDKNGVMQYSFRGGAPTPVFPDIGLKSLPYDVTLADGQKLPVALPATGTADLQKVGKVVMMLATKANPLLRVAAAVSLLCTETSICSDAAGVFTKTKTLGKYFANIPPYYYDGQTACDLIGGSNVTFIDASNPADAFCRNANGTTFGISYAPDQGTTTVQAEPTPQEWLDAAVKLATAQAAEVLKADNQPVPLTGSPTLDPAPITVTGPSKTTATRDASGVQTGSQTETTTATVTPSPTPENPLRVSTTQTTTTTNYDINNTATSTQTVTGDTTSSTTTNNNTDPVDPCDAHPERVGCSDLGEPPVADKMPHTDVHLSYSPISFGGDKTCPAPLALDIPGMHTTIEFDSACQFANTMHPVVITIAFLSAALIVFGVGKKE